MAVQVGMGLSRIILIAGAGYTGTILVKNGKLSDVIGEIQKIVKGLEKKAGDSDGDTDNYDAIAAQVRRLANEVRLMAPSRQITVLNGGSGQGLAALIAPAAALGALGYGYMWWKGLKFSDLMYVTKRNMEGAVSNLTKHLESVQEALAAAKRHLTQRIENVDAKLDEQVEMSRLIRNDVNDLRGDMSQVGFDVDELKKTVAGLDVKLISIANKQELAYAGVMYLCDVAGGRTSKMPPEQLKITGNQLGLKGFADAVLLLTDGSQQDVSSVKPKHNLARTISSKN